MSLCKHGARIGMCEVCIYDSVRGAERARIVAAIRKRWPSNDKYRTILPPHEVADWIEEGCPDGE